MTCKKVGLWGTHGAAGFGECSTEVRRVKFLLSLLWSGSQEDWNWMLSVRSLCFAWGAGMWSLRLLSASWAKQPVFMEFSALRWWQRLQPCFMLRNSATLWGLTDTPWCADRFPDRTPRGLLRIVAPCIPHPLTPLPAVQAVLPL